ncbi:uncharacterized protein LOC134538949 isoform X3 [Bacillus rossius redtenbacheri]|uniref:uncharacterized protein LOC134538949 isoform X3 n=1 Tax=Bacillus rossius redtenbacheri TaxID=93214 RepID=UPI002FDDE00B
MKANRPQNRTCEQQARFIQERISTVEKHFAELCTSFAAYTRKASRLRDKGDELSQTVQSYAEAESVNRSLKTGLLSFSAVMAAIGDYRVGAAEGERGRVAHRQGAGGADERLRETQAARRPHGAAGLHHRGDEPARQGAGAVHGRVPRRGGRQRGRRPPGVPGSHARAGDAGTPRHGQEDVLAGLHLLPGEPVQHAHAAGAPRAESPCGGSLRDATTTSLRTTSPPPRQRRRSVGTRVVSSSDECLHA